MVRRPYPEPVSSDVHPPREGLREGLLVEVAAGDPTDPEVAPLLAEHLDDMRATSPPESVHALDGAGLADPAVTFWVARLGGTVAGCAALKELPPYAGEVKSMRTADFARGQGIGTALLRHLLAEARRRGYDAVFLETGTQPYFAPAHRLYRAHGFTECPPFGDYVLDPNSLFMILTVG